MIGILCGDSNTIYFYSTLGEYLGFNFTSPVKNSVNFKFNTLKEIIITNSTGVYFFDAY
jgi:hypothetical protein